MSEIIKNKYLNLEGLHKYDELIKEFIASEDSKLSAAIAALDAKIGELNVDGSEDKNLAEIVDGIYASIAEIVEKQESLDGNDATLEGKINDIVGDLESLGEGVNQMTLVEIANKLKEVDGSISKNAQDIVGVTERVTAVEEAIKNLGEIEGGESLGEIVSEVKLNTAAIATLKGEGEGSVKKIAADAAAVAESAAKAYAAGLLVDEGGKSKFDDAGTAAALNEVMNGRVEALEAIDHNKIAAEEAAKAVAAVVADADSDFDTLKEVADWIASDKEGSAALQTTVSEHTESISTLTGELDALGTKVDGDIANLTTHMSEAATALAEVDGRLDALEAFEETHTSIEVADIEGLFAQA